MGNVCPRTTVMSDNNMSEHNMSDNIISDNNMSDNNMSDNRMSDNNISYHNMSEFLTVAFIIAVFLTRQRSTCRLSSDQIYLIFIDLTITITYRFPKKQLSPSYLILG